MNAVAMTPLTGLFLGAGASYEVGMPLVWDVTNDMRALLSPERLTLLKERPTDTPLSQEVLDELRGVVARPEMHYESILGYLETQYRRHHHPREVQRQYYALYSWLVEVVSASLIKSHLANAEFLRQNIRFLSGVSEFISKNHPLWVFSLNHDLVVECLAAHLGETVHCGFGSGVVSLPRRDATGKRTGEIRAALLTSADLEASRLTYAAHGVRGINLLKIHGALDVFAFGDEGHDFLRLLPDEDTSVTGILAALRVVNEELYWKDQRSGRRIKPSNEIACAEDSGHVHFLRRSLLAGAYKFDERRDQVLSRRFLDLFRSNVNWVTNLVCVGYSFGDVHINSVLRQWIEFSAERRLEIVDPHAEHVPGFLLHVAPQVTVTKLAATDYFDSVAGVTRDRHDVLMKRLARYGRKQPGQGRQKFADFAKNWLNARTAEAVKAMTLIPRHNGQPDLGGMSPEEYGRRLSQGLDGDTMLEKFLDDQGA